MGGVGGGEFIFGGVDGEAAALERASEGAGASGSGSGELASGWKGALVVLATDSTTNAYAINAGSSTTETRMAWLKRLAEVERATGIDVVALWLPRELNIIPDALSKGLIHSLPMNI